MSAVDANGHVGIHEVPHEGPKLIGTAGAELTNAQGGQLYQFCEQMSFRALNTFSPQELGAQFVYVGPTQWNYMGIHRLDYWLASATIIPIGVWGNRKLTARWQYGTSRDHLALNFRFRATLQTTVRTTSQTT